MSTNNSNRLPFYKPPQQNTNQYKFENADLDKVAVVQRFKNRNTPQVTQGGRANEAGIKLGDTIVKINDTDTKNMSLAEAHQRIQDSGNDIKLSVKSFEDDESNTNEQHEVAMEKKKESDRENWIPQPERKVWHPIVWQQAPPPIPPELLGKDAPHRRIISNIYRFFRETENNPDARKKHIEDLLLALPTALEEKLRAMKKRLAQIAEIPLIIQSTLESVSKTFEGFLPPEPEPEPEIDVQQNEVENDDALSIDSLDHESKEVDQEFEDDGIRSELSLTLSEYSKSDERAKEDFIDSEHDTTPEVEVEPTEEQIVKMEKQIKLQELERSWPWGDQQKKVYKRSNYQISPSSSLIQNRIKQLNEQQLISFYKNEHRID